MIDSALHLLDLSRRAPEIFENGENDEKRLLINEVLSNLELDGDLLRWKIKKPYDTMAFCNKTQNWLGMRDSNSTLNYPKCLFSQAEINGISRCSVAILTAKSSISPGFATKLKLLISRKVIPVSIAVLLLPSTKG